MLLDALPSPDWLKYGFPGLIAVFAILTYFVFKPITQQQRNQKLWVLLFIAVSLVFLSMGGLYVYNADKLKNSHSLEVDSLRTQIQDYQNKISILTGKIPEAELLTAKISENKSAYDSLNRINEELIDSIKNVRGITDDLVKGDILAALDNDLIATEGKKKLEDKIPDVQYKRLKRAVFLNMLAFHADMNILKTALKALQKEKGEFSNADVDRVVDGFAALMVLRLTWLKEQAIPALQHSIEHLKTHPTEQDDPSAQVKLPAQVILLEVDDAHGGNESDVTNMASLIKERDILIHQLTK